MSIAINISQALNSFSGISLDKVAGANLLRRRDNKYVFAFNLLPDLLREVSASYQVLEIENQRSQHYLTIYFDTPDLEMYHLHHRGRVNRHKIRFRKYESSEVIFLEVKQKNAKGITTKKRIQTTSDEPSTILQEEKFLTSFSPYQPGGIIPIAKNGFSRITLVNPDRTERITLDYQLCFTKLSTDLTLETPGICIAEIKYGYHLAGSDFYKALRNAHIPPFRFSKYCMGMAMLNPDLKQNLFKEKVRRVHKINNRYLQSIKN